MKDAAALLSDSMVLRAAWRRVRSWYRGSEWHDPFELADFELNLPQRLTQIGSDLSRGSHKVRPFPLLPYPKKGSHLRHYCAPSVADQVAFAVFGVLLGPLIDNRLESFAFGNRLYRALGQDRDGNKPWKRRPYELDARQLYMPYRRDYALFRRVAHWSAAAMLGTPGRSVDALGEEITPDHFSSTSLPGCCRSGWWRRTPSNEGYWARLDLKMAFPCISRPLLERGFSHVLEAPEEFGEVDLTREPLETALGGYPAQIKQTLIHGNASEELQALLLELLGQVKFSSRSIEERHWRPDDAEGLLLPGNGDHLGLPTGLAVSGLFLNLALSPIDEEIASAQTEDRIKGNPWAFLRFADDMIVLAPTAKILQGALKKVRLAMEGSGKVPTNLRISHSKAAPEPISEWLRGDAGEISRTELEKHVLRGDRLGSFVTRLVEDMSRNAATGSIARFGDAAEQRLHNLADLALLDIDDGEVRADTRLSFAANRLSETFLPMESDIQRSERDLATIRNGVATAIDKAPWKFSLWRAAIRVACRRIPNAHPASQEGVARKWLSTLLRRIAQRQSKNTVRFGTAEQPSRSVVSLELSFLRAMVWREIANVLHELQRAKRLTAEGRWPSKHWTFRALDEGQIDRAIRFISDFDRWSVALYGKKEKPEVLWGWEWKAILFAAHTHPSFAPFDRWNHHQLSRSFARRNPQLLRLVQGIPIKLRRKARTRGPLVRTHISAAKKDEPRIQHELRRVSRKEGPAATLWHADTLGCVHLLESDIAHELRLKKNPTIWDLSVRRIARRRRMMSFDHSGTPAYVHELLWAVREPGKWNVNPRVAPSIPFSSHLATRMLSEALDALGERSSALPPRPECWRIESALLEKARGRQFDAKVPTEIQTNDDATELISLQNSRGWGLCGWHPAFDIPVALGQERTSLARHLWCHVLQFMVAATGSEYWLDLLLDHWPAKIPLDEQWALRSHVHLPSDLWRAIETVLMAVLGGGASIESASENLRSCLAELRNGFSSGRDHFERIDVELKLDPGSILDLPCTSGPLGAPPKLIAPPEEVDEKLRVRLGQIASACNWPALRNRLANRGTVGLTRAERQRVMLQVTQAFRDGDIDGANHAVGPVLLPEVSIPWEELAAIQDLARFYDRATLMGMLWRESPPFLPLRLARANRYLMNEAVFLVPLSHGRQRFIRRFVVQKPLPAHTEYALVESASSSTVTWRLLCGQKWYRFVHPSWGDFTIAICSDLIDPTPWNALQGAVTHLFMVSCNPDIDTFDALTWIRAFELHANVVAVNQGDSGGSFVWTPESGRGKEIARLRGPRLSLLADVSLNVSSLMDHQRDGVSRAVQRAMDEWEGRTPRRDPFKAPPPGFRGRH